MSKNLTNAQLKIITERILIELRKKIITDEVYKKTCDNIAKKIDYTSLKNKVEKYEEIQEEISKLNKESNILYNEVRQAFGNNIYFKIDLNNFLFQYNKLIEDELNNLLPNRYDIESDIILSSINGSKDLISDLINKYTKNNI